MHLAPIALFAYNRAQHLRRTLEALTCCDLAKESTLYVFSDAPKTPEDEYAVSKVREVVKGIDGFASANVVTRRQNLGLANSIISGVSDLCKTYGQVIVLEDDLVVAQGFLRFMNEALQQYRDETAVMQVSGYVYPMADMARLGETFMCRVASSWGWATWERAWTCFNSDSPRLLDQLAPAARRHRFDVEDSYPYFEMLQQHAAGQMDVWGVRWYASMFLKGGLCLYPTESLVQNIGMDGSGMHCNTSTRFDVRLSAKDRWQFTTAVEESKDAVEMIHQFFHSMRQNGHAVTTPPSTWLRHAVRKWHSLVGRVRCSSDRREVM